MSCTHVQDPVIGLTVSLRHCSKTKQLTNEEIYRIKLIGILVINAIYFCIGNIIFEAIYQVEEYDTRISASLGSELL